MISAILRPEITTLESQVAALQAQIAVHAERITLLNEAESVTDGSLAALKGAIAKVSTLAPNALTNLRAAVLSLFGGGDNENQPDDNKVTASTDSEVAVADFNPYKYLNTSCPVYFEGYWETATPDGTSWEFASSLACPLEDCPAESLQGQSYELACDREDKGKHFCELVKVSAAVGYMQKFDGEIIAVYAGGNNKGKLKNWGDWLTRTNSVTSGYQLREGERLGTKWELKLTPMTVAQIDRLATCDFSLDPSSSYPDAPRRGPQRTTVRACEVEEIGVGDRVRSVTVKSWEYIVLGVKDGCYDCERVGITPPIRLAMHPASVELVSKSEAELKVSAMEPPQQQFVYSVLESDNLGQKLSVSRLVEGKQQFLGSVSCGSNTERWSHSRQPKYGQGIPYFPSKEAAATALSEAYERDSAPRLAVAAGIEPDF